MEASMKRSFLLAVMVAFATAAAAQDLQVNEDEWNSLSETDRQTIEELMDQSFKGDQLQITPAPAVPATTSQPGVAGLAGSPFCRPLCDIAAAAALIGCTGLAAPAAALCVAVANQAKQVCYGRCDRN
jgi:hypothetical protein